MDDIGTILFLLLVVFGPMLKKLGEKKQPTGTPAKSIDPSDSRPNDPFTPVPTSTVDPEEELRRFLESLTGAPPSPAIPPKPAGTRQDNEPAARSSERQGSLSSVSPTREGAPKRPPRPIYARKAPDEIRPQRPLPSASSESSAHSPRLPKRRRERPAPVRTEEPKVANMSTYDSQANLGSLARSSSGSSVAPPAPPHPLSARGKTASLRGSLHNRNRLRQAILLSEILSPPRALRPWDQNLQQ